MKPVEPSLSASSPESSGAPTSLRWAVGLILVVTTLAYANSLSAPFLFDDLSAIVRNASIRRLWSWDVFMPPLDAAGATGRPLVNLTLAFNYAIGGTAVRGYHVFNLIVHLASTLLLLGLLRRTLLSENLPAHFRAAALPLATLVALFWAVHPLQTESVTCTIQRTELLGGFFVLLTLYCFSRASEFDASAPGKAPFHLRLWNLGVVGAAVLGIAAKEFVAVVPILVLLYDRTFVAGTFGSAWRLRRGLYLGLGASWLLFALLLWNAPQRNHNVGFGLGVSAWEYLLTQCRAIVLYLKLAFWPHPLIVDYGDDLVRRLSAVWWQAILVVGLIGATLWGLVRRPPVGFCGAWFFIILAPSSSFVPLTTQTMAEHRMYLPVAAVLSLSVLAAFSRWGRAVLFATGGVALFFATLTFARNRDYRTELTLWSSTVSKLPNNPRAHYDFANALSRADRAAEAIPHYELARKLNVARGGPAGLSGAASANLARALLSLGRSDEAVQAYRRGLELDPQSVATRVDLAVTLLQLRRPAEAVPLLQEARQLKPQDPVAPGYLAEALLALRRPDEAIACYQAALRVLPVNVELHRKLANLFLDQNRFDAAIATYQATLRLAGGDHPEVHTNLAIALSEEGQAEAALSHFARAAELEPTNPATRTNLAAALFKNGNLAAARAQLDAALRLDPNYAPAREILAAWPKAESPP